MLEQPKTGLISQFFGKPKIGLKSRLEFWNSEFCPIFCKSTYAFSYRKSQNNNIPNLQKTVSAYVHYYYTRVHHASTQKHNRLDRVFIEKSKHIFFVLFNAGT